jgi:hypothetical protein
MRFSCRFLNRVPVFDPSRLSGLAAKDEVIPVLNTIQQGKLTRGNKSQSEDNFARKPRSRLPNVPSGEFYSAASGAVCLGNLTSTLSRAMTTRVPPRGEGSVALRAVMFVDLIEGRRGCCLPGNGMAPADSFPEATIATRPWLAYGGFVNGDTSRTNRATLLRLEKAL